MSFCKQLCVVFEAWSLCWVKTVLSSDTENVTFFFSSTLYLFHCLIIEVFISMNQNVIHESAAASLWGVLIFNQECFWLGVIFMLKQTQAQHTTHMTALLIFTWRGHGRRQDRQLSWKKSILFSALGGAAVSAIRVAPPSECSGEVLCAHVCVSVVSCVTIRMSLVSTDGE